MLLYPELEAARITLQRRRSSGLRGDISGGCHSAAAVPVHLAVQDTLIAAAGRGGTRDILWGPGRYRSKTGLNPVYSHFFVKYGHLCPILQFRQTIVVSLA